LKGACENTTTVTITPSAARGVHAANAPYTVALNSGQTYYLRNTNGPPGDLSGTTIKSDKPVGVFSGHIGL